MKKRFGLTVLVGLVASVASLQAAPCSSVSTLADLIALTTTGCTLDDKLFNNFAYTPGAGAPASSAIDANAVSTFPTEGFFFNTAGGFQGNFLLSFAVAVVPAPICPTTCLITDTESQQFPATQPPGTQAFSIVVSTGPSPVMLNNVTFGGNTSGTTFTGVTSLTEIATSSGISPADPLLGVQLRVSESVQSVIPEPATLALTGAGLLALGLLGRRRKSKS